MAYNPSQSSSSSWWQPQPPSQSSQPPAQYPNGRQAGTSTHALGWGTQSQLGEDTMEDTPTKGLDHLPGYLTNASYGRSPPSVHSPSLSSSSRQTWSGPPLGRNTASASSSSPPGPIRFGTGSLFDSRSRPDPYNDSALPVLSASYEDAPPVHSLDDPDAGESSYPPMLSMSDSQSTQHQYEDYASSSSPFGSGSLASTIIVFGPPMSHFLQPLLQYFSLLGDIVGSEVDSSGGNWVTIVYRHEWEAARAVRKDGEVLGGVWMIGVKWADPNRNDQPTSLSDASPSLTPQHHSLTNTLSPLPPATSTLSSNSSSSLTGRPIQLAPSASAFRRESPRPPTAGDGKSFLVKESLGGPQQGGGTTTTEGGKGVLGKLGELVFGF